MAGGMVSAMILAAVVMVGQPAVPLGREGTVQERQQYRRLVREIRDLDREYEKELQASLAEARGSSSGEVSLQRQADLTNLRDERDRKQQRLEVLALRHGWPIDVNDPSADTESGGAGSAAPSQLSDKEQVFASAAADIRDRARLDAQRIALSAPLRTTPVIIPR